LSIAVPKVGSGRQRNDVPRAKAVWPQTESQPCRSKMENRQSVDGVGGL